MRYITLNIYLLKADNLDYFKWKGKERKKQTRKTEKKVKEREKD